MADGEIAELIARLHGPQAENALCSLTSIPETLPVVAAAYGRGAQARTARDADPLPMVFVDKILKGANLAHLPVEQPSKFELVINVRAAKALGLAIPQAMLLRADEVMR